MGNTTSNTTIPPLCQMPFAFPLNIIPGPYCDAGYYCPNIVPGWNFTYPSVCSPTIDCIKERLGSQYCPAQGLFEPILCPAGSYCPNFTTMLTCPENSYCMRGSTEPLECPPMSICPEGTEMRRFYGGVVLSLLFDLVAVVLYFWLRYYYEPRTWKQRRAARVALLAGTTSSGVPPSSFELTSSSAWRGLRGMLGRAAGGGGPGVQDGGYAALSERLTADGASATSLDDDGVAGSPAPTAPSTLAAVSAKAELEAGFRRCNAGLRLDFDFRDLALTLPPPVSKTILSDVSGRIRPGRVTAVMGPSGAGKTTFLSVLMGRVARTGGVLRINGKEDEMFRYKKIVGFVPQDDTMVRELTVRENILFSARVRLPRHGWTDDAIQRHVDAVIDVLGLTECADTLSDRVSGGQRKRTNIGMELAMAPAAIFLDEPTSGLDSTAALEVCRTLRAIADLGLTVVAVIHQPRMEIFETFDDLLLLAPGGLTVYMGPQGAVLPYFKEVGFAFTPGHNPADDLLDCVAGMGTPAQMEGFWARMGAGGLLSSSPDSSFDLGGGGASTPSAFTPQLHQTASFASLNSEETGTSSLLSPSGGGSSSGGEGGHLSKKTRRTAHILAEFWVHRGPALLERVRPFTSPRTQGKLKEAFFVGDGVGGSLRPAASTGSLQSVAAGGGDEDACAASFDPVAMTADRGASFLRQVYFCHNRSIVQQYRQATSYALEMGVGMLAGGMMGLAASQVPELYMGVLKPPYTLISPAPIETLLPSIGLYIALAAGLAGSPAGVRTFGEERDVYYREASSGHNKLAYYVAKTLSMLYRFTSGAFHFAAVFHVFACPSMPFTIFFVIVICQYYAVYGLAAITSMVVKRENSALLGVIASLVAGCLCGFGPSLAQMRGYHLDWVQHISYARWASEAWFHYETLPYRSLYMVEDVSASLFGYTLDRFGFDIGMMILIGTAYRAVAFVLLVGLNRDKQR